MMSEKPIKFISKQSAPPASAVFIGPAPAADEAAAEFSRQHAATLITRLANDEHIFKALAAGPRFDLAVLIDTLEMRDKTSAGHLLAALRDVYCKCLIVIVRLGDDWENVLSHWHGNELLAFGMQRLNAYQQHGKSVGVFEFKLRDYKVKPRWLNPKHWAHPELWEGPFE